MKYLIYLSFSLSYAFAHTHHLPLELTFEESQAIYSKLEKNQTKDGTNLNTPYIQGSIAGGEKMSQWLALINKNRTEENKIRLTSKKTQRGIPVEKPSKYGPSTIEADFKKLIQAMPIEMAQIIYGKDSIQTSPIVSDEDFITWAKKVSRLYQTAVRWMSYQRWLPQMSQRKYKDIRGYYHLNKIADLDRVLEGYHQTTADEQQKLAEHLNGICLNSLRNEAKCESKLKKAIAADQLVDFKNLYWNNSKKVWDSFFEISDPRRDVTWDSPNVMHVKFKDPNNDTIANWLKENVEDEFQIPLKNWRLEMKFERFGFGLSYIEFQKNVTPHVSGGNKVVMDANTALEEYGVRWTIRHEYGHILRLPDCYHEFYDAKNNLMINYQLDTTDLMCSRAGQMNDRIYEELKRVYYRP